jgi:predicted nuclease of predicted toxin-antitoxin system
VKFLADVNVPRPLISRLLAEGHEVLSVIDIDRRLKDPSILRLALAEGALILTNDKDYKRHRIGGKATSAWGCVATPLSASTPPAC